VIPLLWFACAQAPSPLSEPAEVGLRPDPDAPCQHTPDLHHAFGGYWLELVDQGDTHWLVAGDVLRPLGGTDRFLSIRIADVAVADGRLLAAARRDGVWEIGVGRLPIPGGDVVAIDTAGPWRWAVDTGGVVHRWRDGEAPTRFVVDGEPAWVRADGDRAVVLGAGGTCTRLPSGRACPKANAVTWFEGRLVHTLDGHVFVDGVDHDVGAPVHALDVVDDHVVVATTERVLRLDDDGLTVLAAAPGSRIHQLTTLDGRLAAVAGAGGLLRLDPTGWTTVEPGSILDTLDGGDDLYVAHTTGTGYPFDRWSDRARVELPSNAMATIRRGDGWLVGTAAGGVVPVDASHSAGTIVLPDEPLYGIDADDAGPWTALSTARGLLTVEDGVVLRETPTEPETPVGGVVRMGDDDLVVYMVDSRADRFGGGERLATHRMSAPLYSLLRPFGNGRVRRDTEIWLPMPSWGVAQVSGDTWTEHRVSPGVWDTAPATEGRWLALGRRGVGRLVDGELVERCPAPGVTRHVTQVGDVLWTGGNSTLTRWAPM
jgi:hypothetical protein